MEILMGAMVLLRCMLRVGIVRRRVRRDVVSRRRQRTPQPRCDPHSLAETFVHRGASYTEAVLRTNLLLLAHCLVTKASSTETISLTRFLDGPLRGERLCWKDRWVFRMLYVETVGLFNRRRRRATPEPSS